MQKTKRTKSAAKEFEQEDEKLVKSKIDSADHVDEDSPAEPMTKKKPRTEDAENEGEEVVEKTKNPEEIGAEKDDGPPAKKSRKEQRLKDLSAIDPVKFKIIKKGEIIRCKATRAQQLGVLQELKDLLRGKYLKYVYNHTVSRVIEWMIKLSEPEFTAMLVDEMKDQLKVMVKKKYAVHVVRCLIDKSNKNALQLIVSKLAPDVLKLLTMPCSAPVVTDILKKATNDQKLLLKHNFYGTSFKIFKTKEILSLQDVVKLNQTEKDGILNEVNDNLKKVIEKTKLDSPLTVTVLREYLEVVEAGSAKHTAFINILQSNFANLDNFKEGSWLAAQCLWNSSAKERKQIMKTCKEKLKVMSESTVGATIITTMMDCIDDTTLINKIVLQPLLDDCVNVSSNVNGVRVLAFAVRPRSSLFLHPEQIKFLEEGDKNQHSKKDHAVRQQEIKSFVVPILAAVVEENLSPWIQDAQRFLLMKAFMENSEIKEVKGVMETFTYLLADPDHLETSTFKGVESKLVTIELPFAQKLAMHLIKEDKRKYNLDSSYKPVFCDMLVPKIKESPEFWLKSNRGMLTFLCLMETEIPSVVEEVRQMLSPHVDALTPQIEKSKVAKDLLTLLGTQAANTTGKKEKSSKKK